LEIRCHRISGGKATGPALVTEEPISFLGTVDPETGVVVDPGHQLFGKAVAGKVLIFPGGKGSTVGSYVIYQLKKRGVAPQAMINIRSEPIVAVGAIISGIPLVDGVDAGILATRDGTILTVDADREVIRVEEP
jgi:predicted aconitase with swiveling domain